MKGKTYMGQNSEGEGEDIHGTEQGRGRHTWDRTGKGKGKTYMGRKSEGEGGDIGLHGTER